MQSHGIPPLGGVHHLPKLLTRKELSAQRRKGAPSDSKGPGEASSYDWNMTRSRCKLCNS